MHLYYAHTIAQSLLLELKPFCETDRCFIAGSVRRKREEVKDIEIVCIPLKYWKEEKNLFDEVVSRVQVIHPEFESIVRGVGTIIKGKFIGRYMQIEMVREIEGTKHIINLDLFMPQPHDFFRQLAIRTGSADYAHKHIANAWLRKGWCGVNGDLRLQKQCIQAADKKWLLKSDVKEPTIPPHWKSEQEFFKWLGVQYLEPQHRSL